MNRDQLEELAALHALGLLEGEERRAFEQEIASNPAARQVVAELNTAAAGLAFTADSVEPPAALRARVLAALPERKLSSRPAPTTAPSRDNVVPFRWIPWALAACFAIATGLMFVKYDEAKKRVATLELDRESARRELAAIIIERESLQTRVAALEQSRIVDRLQLATLQTQGNANPNATAVAAWDPQTQLGLLKVANLPPPAADREYQLWVVDPQSPDDPVDGGVFTTTQAGDGRFIFKTAKGVSAVAAFAVTDEPKGGVPKATGPMVLLGE